MSLTSSSKFSISKFFLMSIFSKCCPCKFVFEICTWTEGQRGNMALLYDIPDKNVSLISVHQRFCIVARTAYKFTYLLSFFRFSMASSNALSKSKQKRVQDYWLGWGVYTTRIDGVRQHFVCKSNAIKNA